MTAPEPPADPSPEQRLTGPVLLRLTGALVALAAGATGLVIVIVLVRTVLSL